MRWIELRAMWNKNIDIPFCKCCKKAENLKINFLLNSGAALTRKVQVRNNAVPYFVFRDAQIGEQQHNQQRPEPLVEVVHAMRVIHDGGLFTLIEMREVISHPECQVDKAPRLLS